MEVPVGQEAAVREPAVLKHWRQQRLAEMTTPTAAVVTRLTRWGLAADWPGGKYMQEEQKLKLKYCVSNNLVYSGQNIWVGQQLSQDILSALDFYVIWAH
jgi:hypothetical protein